MTLLVLRNCASVQNLIFLFKEFSMSLMASTRVLAKKKSN